MPSKKRKSRDQIRRQKKKDKARRRAQHKRKLVESIRKFDDPILKQKCEPVAKGDDLGFIDYMRKVLDATKDGIGLAAPQIGVTKRVIVWKEKVDSVETTVMVNPEIEEKSEDTTNVQEGCLSYPGIYAYIERPRRVKVKYRNAFGSEKSNWYDGIASRVVQHEIDHLDGVCKVGDAWAEQQAAAA